MSKPDIDLHRHLEGSLFAEDLIVIMETMGLPFDNSTIQAIRTQVRDGLQENTIHHFIAMLTTRWMKVALLKIYMAYSHNPEEANQHAGELIDRITQRVLLDAKEEGITFLNVLTSSLNMAVDGDLSLPEVKKTSDAMFKDARRTSPFRDEEYQVYRSFQKQLEHESFAGVVAVGLTSEEVLRRIDGIRKEGNKGFPETLLSFSLRRDKDKDKICNGANFIPVVEMIERLFVDGVIDLVDLCGDESNPEYAMEKYTEFFEELGKRGIPFTLHAGEIHYWNRSYAYRNLLEAIQLKPLMIAHAVRLLDNNKRAQGIVELALKYGVNLALNVSSNIKTGITQSAGQHNLLSKLLAGSGVNTPLASVSTDDPVVYARKHDVDVLQKEYMIIAKVGVKKGKNKEQTERFFRAQAEVTRDDLVRRIRDMRQKKKVEPALPVVNMCQPSVLELAFAQIRANGEGARV
jgi:adenosine deaminase